VYKYNYTDITNKETNVKNKMHIQCARIERYTD
jgi:hypothetical protein